jgi:hypothetical protein
VKWSRNPSSPATKSGHETSSQASSAMCGILAT